MNDATKAVAEFTTSVIRPLLEQSGVLVLAAEMTDLVDCIIGNLTVTPGMDVRSMDIVHRNGVVFSPSSRARLAKAVLSA
eukprot:SAG31_NODE_717_length_12611_cov_25.933104_7_plen_80_part_00